MVEKARRYPLRVTVVLEQGATERERRLADTQVLASIGGNEIVYPDAQMAVDARVVGRVIRQPVAIDEFDAKDRAHPMSMASV